MKQKVTLSPKQYTIKNPQKAAIIKRAVKRGVKEYGETFKRLAAV